MFRYFKPRRRKIGAILLIAACVLTAAWIRSCSVVDTISFSTGGYGACLVSGNQKVRLFFKHELPLDAIVKGNAQGTPLIETWQIDFDRSSAEFNHRSTTMELGAIFSRPSMQEFKLIPYWPIVIPLILLTVWLLFPNSPKTRTDAPRIESSP